MVLSCVAAKPSARPTAAQVVKMLDKLIRNIVNKVRKQLPPEEEALLKRMRTPVAYIILSLSAYSMKTF